MITKKEYRKNKLQDEQLEDAKAEQRAKLFFLEQINAENQAKKKLPRKPSYHANEED